METKSILPIEVAHILLLKDSCYFQGSYNRFLLFFYFKRKLLLLVGIKLIYICHDETCPGLIGESRKYQYRLYKSVLYIYICKISYNRENK